MTIPFKEKLPDEFIRYEEERLLRQLDSFVGLKHIDQRWLAIARTKFQEAYMCLVRAYHAPDRVKLPEDNNPHLNPPNANTDPLDPAVQSQKTGGNDGW